MATGYFSELGLLGSILALLLVAQVVILRTKRMSALTKTPIAVLMAFPVIWVSTEVISRIHFWGACSQNAGVNIVGSIVPQSSILVSVPQIALANFSAFPNFLYFEVELPSRYYPYAPEGERVARVFPVEDQSRVDACHLMDLAIGAPPREIILADGTKCLGISYHSEVTSQYRAEFNTQLRNEDLRASDYKVYARHELLRVSDQTLIASVQSLETNAFRSLEHFYRPTWMHICGDSLTSSLLRLIFENTERQQW